MAFDALVATHLARGNLAFATNADARGIVLNDLGVMLQTLGERESGTARLDEAVQAYSDALLEWTRERVPLDWAATHFNISKLETAYFDKTDDTAHLDATERTLAMAREVFEEAGATQYLAIADQQQSKIAARHP